MMKPDANIRLKPRSELARLSIIIDTREQAPWFFPEHLAETKRGTLAYGDYALEVDGKPDVWCIERKSLPDFIGTVTADWPRFERELGRMPVQPTRVVIVEGDMRDIRKYVTELLKRQREAGIIDQIIDDKAITDRCFYVMRRIAELTMLGVSVLFCGDAALAPVMAYRLFRRRLAFLSNVADLDVL